MKKGNLKQNKAITLVALVITIIILLILATITIEGLKNTNLFSKTIDAKNKYKHAEANEANILDDYAKKIESISGNNKKTIEISGNKVTVTENGTTYTATIDKTIDPSDGNFDENTKNVLSKVYGTEVEYKSDSNSNKDIDSKTWRIFYIDFANKYGDGAGTIYLKADWTVNDTILSGYSAYTPSETDKITIKNMNQKWYTARGTATWNDNEHEAAWLCSPSQWTKYKNSNANYAIGSPSTEIYCDSYNSVNHTIGNYKFTCQYQTSSVPGYGYKVDGNVQNSGYKTDDETVDYVDYNSMYIGYKGKAFGDFTWWLSSPSAEYTTSICTIYGYDVNLYSEYHGLPEGICPLVSLPVNIKLNIK